MLAAVLGGAGLLQPALAQERSTIDMLRDMSLEELGNIEFTSVSKRPQRMSQVPAAIEVITRDDIRRSGATSLPEALRLAGGLELAQINAAQWAISARGFNAPLSNKMLVLIDGRTVYSPLFSGVFWELQDVMLEDVDRIEVIRGPGATVWGANAVNGVINITTRAARDTQGLHAEAAVGTELRAQGALRYGGEIAPGTHFRAYGQYASRDSTVFADGRDPGNDWDHAQAGFRIDSQTAGGDQMTLQGDAYDNTIKLVGPQDIESRGQNLLARWSRSTRENSSLGLQLFVDRVQRDSATSFSDTALTYDLDFQHQLRLGSRHDVVWGAGYRRVEDDFRSIGIGLRPERDTLQTWSVFVQDEIALRPEVLHLTLGTKLEENDYTGFEFQPGVRLAWTLPERQLLWSAISRAVRIPARVDRAYYIPPVSIGSPNLESEELLAYEVGYRAQPFDRLSWSLSAYYNDYDDIRSVEPSNPPAPLPLEFGNGQKAEGYGAELSAEFRVNERWRLRADFSELHLDIRPKAGSFDASFGRGEAADSRRHALLRSSTDFPGNLQLDVTLRYVSRIENPDVTVPGYSEADLRLGWQATGNLEIALVGQNLLHDRHGEMGLAAVRQEMERSVYGRLVWRQ